MAVPDGGWGWVIVAASSTGVGLLMGCVNALYAVQYTQMIRAFNTTAAAVGMVFTIYILAVCVPFPLHNLLMTKFGQRKVAIPGAILGSAGFVASCFSENVVTMALTMGGIGGFFFGAYLFVILVAPQMYFDKKRGLAGGLSIVGSSVGFLVYGPIAELLTEHYGWRGARLISCGIMMNCIPLSLLYRPLESRKVPPDKQPKIRSYSVSSQVFHGGSLNSLRSGCNENTTKKDSHEPTSRKRSIGDWCGFICPLALAMCGMTVISFGLSSMYSHIVNRCLDIGLSDQEAAMMTTVFGVANLIGRVVFTLATTLPCTKILVMCCCFGIMTGLNICLLGFTYHLWDSVLVTCTTGLSIGGYFSVQMTSLRNMAGIEYFPQALSVVNVGYGIAGAIAVPLAGWIYDSTGDYNLAFIIAGGVSLFGACTVCVAVLIRAVIQCDTTVKDEKEHNNLHP